MTTVSIRELKQKIDQNKRLTQIAHGEQVVTPVSVDKSKDKSGDDEWSQFDILAAEIGANWKSGISAVIAFSQGRR
jgi:hypothetical protein